MEALGLQGQIDLRETRVIADVSSGYTEFQDGDVVVAKITPCFENGKAALAHGLKNSAAYGTTELHVLRANKPLNEKFLYYVAVSETFRKLGEYEMYGAGGQKRVPPDFCKNFLTPLPPPHEQQTIVDFLDREVTRIDQLVLKKTDLFERLKEKRSALISRTVTCGLPPEAARAAGMPESPRRKPSGIDWIGDIPAHWDVRKFSREVRIAEGQVNPEIEPYAKMLLIGPEHVQSGTGSLIKRETAMEQGAESGKYYCQQGDIVYSKIRPALSKLVIAPEDCLCSADMYPLRGRFRLRNNFIFWLFLSQQFAAWSVLESDRVAMPKINRDTLNELRMPVPPIPEQDAIASFLSSETAKLDVMTTKVGTAIERLQEYRAALINAAVTGKIDVRKAIA
jgi:restriction endonuclease S subunit